MNRKILFTMIAVSLLISPVANTYTLSAATNDITVKVKRDANGYVDYKNFYQDGTRFKYEDWDNGVKRNTITYRNGVVSMKVFYDSSGQKTKVEKWTKGQKVTLTTFQNGKFYRRFYYTDNGQVLVRDQWIDGKFDTRTYFRDGKVVLTKAYTNGVRTYQQTEFTSRTYYPDGKLQVAERRYDDHKTIKFYRQDGTIERQDYYFQPTKFDYAKVNIYLYDQNGNKISQQLNVDL